MKSNKTNYVLVGGFVLASVAGGIMAVAMLTGQTGATDPYYAYYGNVTGLKYGSQVVYEGYPIGQVEEITPEPGETGMRFRVDLAITEGWRIPVDSEAQIGAAGLLSAVGIQIAAGDSTEALKPGSEVPSIPPANIFAVVSSVAGQVSDLAETSLKPLLTDVGRGAGILADILEDDGKQLVAQVADLMKRAPGIANDIEQFAEQMNGTSAELQNIFSPENRGKINDMIGQFSTLSDDIRATQQKLDTLLVTANGMMDENRGDVRESVEHLRYSLDTVSRHVDALSQNLEATSRNMYEFSRQIRSNPGVLLGGVSPADQGKSK